MHSEVLGESKFSIDLVCSSEFLKLTAAVSLQKIANVIPTAGVKQSAKVLGPLVTCIIALLAVLICNSLWVTKF